MFPLLLGSESEYLAAFARDAVLDVPLERDFERIASLAAHRFGVPVARPSFVSRGPVALEPISA